MEEFQQDNETHWEQEHIGVQKKGNFKSKREEEFYKKGRRKKEGLKKKRERRRR